MNLTFKEMFERVSYDDFYKDLYKIFISHMPEYGNCPWEVSFNQFKELSQKVEIRNTKDMIEFYRYKETDDMKDMDNYSNPELWKHWYWVYDVGLKIEGEEYYTSICYTEWKDILSYPINPEFFKEITYSEALAAFLWEMTWFGYDQEKSDEGVKKALNVAIERMEKG